MTFRPTMSILYGPPGTGKTWFAARAAVGAVLPEKYAAWVSGALSDQDLLSVHHQLVLLGRIKWVTFHPSYSYEDFVEGFRPLRAASGETISFEVRKGPFREICDIASGRPGSFGPPVGSEISAIGGNKTFEVVSFNDQGWFLRTRPNRSDQVGETQVKFVTRQVIERAAELGLEPRVFSIPGKGTFNPSDYGLKESSEMTGAAIRRLVGQQLGISSSDLANSSHFGAVATYIKQQDETVAQPTTACLVIDEINRADLARVFGELITLLEPDKRLGAREERRLHLPYSGDDRFGVPSTLSVIGTMNTADRSVTSMDFAMRRRFTFIEVAPDPKLCPVDYGGVDVQAALAGINRRIEVLRGRDYRLGHATFMLSALEDTRLGFSWSEDADGRRRALAYAFRNRVVPLLNEYFHEDFRKIEIALGTRKKRFGSGHLPLFDSRELTAADQAVFAEVFETDGAMLGQPSQWWNPESTAFDGDAFSAAVSGMG